MDDVAHEASRPSDDTSAAAVATDQTGTDVFDAEKVTQALQEQVQILDSCTDESKLLAALEAINDVVDGLAGLADQSGVSVTPPENIDRLLQPAVDAAVHVKVTDIIKKYVTPDVNHRELSSQQSYVLEEAFCLLANLASGTEQQKKVVTDTGVVPIVLATLMKSEQRSVLNHCIVLINNLVVEPESLSLVPIRADLLEKLLKMLQKARTHAQEYGLNTDTIEHVARIMCFFNTLLDAEVDVGDRLNEKLLHSAFATLIEFGDSCTDIFTEAIGVIYNASNVMSSNAFYQIMIINDYVPLIVKFMASENADVREGVVAIVSNLMVGQDDIDVTSVMRSSVFNHVSHLLLTDEQTISQVAWMTSNAVAGTESMANIVFDHNLLPLVVSLLQSSCRKVVVGSLRVIINLVGYLSDEQKWSLLKHDKYGVLSAIIPLLSTELSKLTPSEEIVFTLCNIFVNILRVHLEE